jgi:hypothetical protein
MRCSLMKGFTSSRQVPRAARASASSVASASGASHRSGTDSPGLLLTEGFGTEFRRRGHLAITSRITKPSLLPLASDRRLKLWCLPPAQDGRR